MQVNSSYCFRPYTSNNKKPVNTRPSFTAQKDYGDKVTIIGGRIPDTIADKPTYSEAQEDAAKEEFRTLVHGAYNFKKLAGELGSGSQEKVQAVNDWVDFLKTPNNKIAYPEKVVILNGVMEHVRPDDYSNPLVLEPEIVMSTLAKYRRASNKDGFSFHDVYQDRLRDQYLEKEQKEGLTWIVIPSKDHDPQNYNDNIKKLQVLSRQTWEPSGYAAEDYLKYGDFHLLLKDGKPAVGMNILFGEVAQIHGKDSNSIPLSCLEEVNEYINREQLCPSESARSQLDYGYECAEKVKEIRDIINEVDEDSDSDEYSLSKTERILNALDISCSSDGNGKLAISHYSMPEMLKGEDIGLDENKLFRNISIIKGNADFAYTNVTNTGILSVIGGDASFGYSKIVKIPKLKKIKGSADFSNSIMKSTGSIEEVGKDVILGNSALENTGELRRVGGNLSYKNSKIRSTNKVEYVKGNVSFVNSVVKHVKGLKRVDGRMFTRSSLLTVHDLRHVENAQNKPFARFLHFILGGDDQQ